MPSSRNALFNLYYKVLEIKSPFRLAVASPTELLVVGRGYLGGGFVQLPHALALLPAGSCIICACPLRVRSHQSPRLPAMGAIRRGWRDGGKA